MLPWLCCLVGDRVPRNVLFGGYHRYSFHLKIFSVAETSIYGKILAGLLKMLIVIKATFSGGCSVGLRGQRFNAY